MPIEFGARPKVRKFSPNLRGGDLLKFRQSDDNLRKGYDSQGRFEINREVSGILFSRSEILTTNYSNDFAL